MLGYQFKITLEGVKPVVWRRILVPEYYSFWDLHVAIQDAMGWQDYHLHKFLFDLNKYGIELRIGIPDPDFPESFIPSWSVHVKNLFTSKNSVCRYTYDFGDGWEHSVLFEQAESAGEDLALPLCLEGENSCPPEDCGGPPGYANFLDAMNNPQHPEHEEFKEWIGGSFDPKSFLPEEVVFDDPDERFKIAFEQ